MVFPSLMSRVKKRRGPACFGIDPRQIGAFMQITINAGEGQIIQIVSAPMHFWDNVLNVKGRQRGVFLTQVAVLATLAGAFSNTASYRWTHRL